jgi:hypothetical protein
MRVIILIVIIMIIAKTECYYAECSMLSVVMLSSILSYAPIKAITITVIYAECHN